MNPILMGTIGTVVHLTRQCQKCGRKQATTPNRQHESVKCHRCGIPIPPQKRSRSGR